jgi:hypothetical protein
MLRRRLGIFGVVAPAAIAMILLGWIGFMPASAAPVRADGAVTRTAPLRPDEIVGVYKTYAKCNAAGAKGIREDKWINYLCSQIHEGSDWYLSVERGKDVTASTTYSDKVSTSITCANFAGKIGWGGLGLPVDNAYLRIAEPYSVLEDTCGGGYARLYIHYDTFDNPKTVKIR